MLRKITQEDRCPAPAPSGSYFTVTLNDASRHWPFGAFGSVRAAVLVEGVVLLVGVGAGVLSEALPVADAVAVAEVFVVTVLVVVGAD